jgi:GntR family transcriptional regulator, transcriptional repressor for pyruvate dehydrogenase complex
MTQVERLGDARQNGECGADRKTGRERDRNLGDDMAKRAKATDLTAVGVGRVKRKAIGQQVVSRILELIRTGSLRAGDRLPAERELIEIFGISRPSLREALRALSTLGVVRSQHGGGAYVSDLDARTLLAPLDFYISLTKANFADAFDSRRVIEIEIVRRAAAKADRADVEDLQDIVEAHDTVQDDPVGFRILDTRFHEKISAIAGNAILQRIAYGLYNLGLDFQNFDRRARNDPGLICQSTADHSEIAAAIIAHDPDRAAQAMCRHIRNIELSTQRVISGPSASSAEAPQSRRAAKPGIAARAPAAARRRSRA